ncbi:MAG: ABC transporter permease [Candidatus Dormibacteraeota bacterium]|nr:ABC transporter permease [Candidatus Dormibacteraeota bacterium]
MIRIQRRQTAPRWLLIAVPVVSLVAAFAAAAVVLLVAGKDPVVTYQRLFDRAFFGPGALTSTLVTATPLLLTGLAAAAAFRMRLWNIGGEGQLYLGAVGASGAGIALHSQPGPVLIAGMILAGALAGAIWAVVPGILKAYFNTNEIITTLMLNYVAGLLLLYLIFDSHSYWRDLSTFSARQFPQGKVLVDAAAWPTFDLGIAIAPFGFVLGIVAALALWLLYRSTVFGFQVRVLGDSASAARYAGIKTRRVLVAMMALSGALAGLGGASEVGDFRHVLDPRGLQQAGLGYAGIVVAALARYNPFAVAIVAVLIGGLANAGYSLQGPDFPAGLVGVLQGMILFFALGGELLLRYRVTFGSPRAAGPREAAVGASRP